MSAVESDCALLRLPREIRDEIYSYCFDRTYKVFWTYYDNRHPDGSIFNRNQNEPVIADLSILRTSTALSSDAKYFLFCRAASKATTFEYHIDFNYRRFCPPPVKEATDRMMNVEFLVVPFSRDDAGYTDKSDTSGYQGGIVYPAPIISYPTSTIEQICGETLDHFTGTAIFRNSFRIRIALCSPDEFGDLVDFVNTRFFQALKNLKGFQKLTISLVICNLREEDEDRKLHEEVAKVVTDLKTHLGPCIEKSTESPLYLDLVTWSDLELEFQPRKYYIETLRAEAERAAKGADRSGEEHTQETQRIIPRGRAQTRHLLGIEGRPTRVPGEILRPAYLHIHILQSKCKINYCGQTPEPAAHESDPQYRDPYGFGRQGFLGALDAQPQ